MKVVLLKFENKKLIIFDLDGTLINSALDLALAVNYMLQTLNRDTFSEDTIHGWVGNGAETLVNRALSGKSDVDKTLDATYAKNALEIFLTYYAQNLCVATATYPNVTSTLKTLQKKGYLLSIVTNKPFDFVGPILTGLGLDGLFELILGGDSLDVKKPNPEPLLHVCNALKVSVKDSLMVGDSKNDILAANACGMHSVGVTYGYNYGKHISLHKPSVIVDDFENILKVLVK
jgi:phosphoglycolate phosphatase